MIKYVDKADDTEITTPVTTMHKGRSQIPKGRSQTTEEKKLPNGKGRI